MKRLLSVFTLCATALIAASAVSSPAAAEGRYDTRRHAGQSDRQTSYNFTDRGEQRRALRGHRDHRHHKFWRHHKRHRHGHAYGHRHRHGHAYGHRHRHGYGPPRHRHGYGYGPPRHRHGYGYGPPRHRHGYGYGPPRHRLGYRPGAGYALQLDGVRIILRSD
jgi:hypothetical protein